MTSSGAVGRFAVDLPASTQAPAVARQWVRQVLSGWNLGPLVADACLVVSELVTNAVRHAVGAQTYPLELERTETGIRVSVTDPSPMLPVVRDVDVDAPDGRGMLIITGLVLAWGWEPEPTGKRVWVDIARATQGSAAMPGTAVAGEDATAPPARAVRQFAPTVLDNTDLPRLG